MIPIRMSLYDDFRELNRNKNLGILFEAAIVANVDPTAIAYHAQEVGSIIDTMLTQTLSANEMPVTVGIRDVASIIRALYEQNQ